MSFISVKIYVTAALPADGAEGGKVEIAAWIFPPSPAKEPAKPTTIALLNGGTDDKRYFHFEVPGRRGYGAAAALADCGHLVILPDRLGIFSSYRL